MNWGCESCLSPRDTAPSPELPVPAEAPAHPQQRTSPGWVRFRPLRFWERLKRAQFLHFLRLTLYKGNFSPPFKTRSHPSPGGCWAAGQPGAASLRPTEPAWLYKSGSTVHLRPIPARSSPSTWPQKRARKGFKNQTRYTHRAKPTSHERPLHAWQLFFPTTSLQPPASAVVSLCVTFRASSSRWPRYKAVSSAGPAHRTGKGRRHIP